MFNFPCITTLLLPKKITNTENVQLDHGWHELKTLDLQGIDFESFHTLSLIKFANFNKLNLSNAKIDDEDLSIFRNVGKLKILDLSNCYKISGRGLAHLPSLLELKITGCPLVREDDLDLQHLLKTRIHWSLGRKP